MVVGLDDLLPFGQYQGQQVEDVLGDDPEYLLWMAETGNVDFDEEILQILDKI